MSYPGEQESGSIAYWIHADEEDPVRLGDLGFKEFLADGYVRPSRNLLRRLRGERRPFTFDRFTDELAHLKLLTGGEWEPIDYAEAVEPHVGFHVELEDTDEEVELDELLSPFEQSKTRNLATLSYLPDKNAALIQVPAILKESGQARAYFTRRIMDIVERRRLYEIYPMEMLRNLVQERALVYPYLYNKALFEQLSHVAAGHPIPIAGSSDDYFWPHSWPAILPPLRDLPQEELSAVAHVRRRCVRL